MRNYPLIFIYLVVILFIKNAFAQDIFDLGELYFESIGNKESIPLCCTAVRQDETGFVWIGTQKGLVRYDGYRFNHFIHSVIDPESIGGNYIQTLWMANDGRVWVGTVSSGISVFEPKTNKFKRYQHDPNNMNSLSHNYINAITGDNNGNFWFGTKKGLDHFDSKTQQFTHYVHNANDPSSINGNVIYALLFDKQGNLWVGTNKGLSKLSLGSTSFENVLSDHESQRLLLEKGVTSLFQAHDGKLWVGTQANGSFWIDTQSHSQDNISFGLVKLKQTKQVRIKSIAQPNPNEIWLGSFGDGIYVVNANDGVVKRHLLHDETISSSLNFNHIGELFVDSSGMLWIGTYGGGMNRFNPKNSAFQILRHSPNHPNKVSHSGVNAVLELKNGRIWLGNQGNGIEVIDPEYGVIARFRASADNPNGMSDDFITELAQTSDGIVWIGTRRGLQRYDEKTNKFSHYTQTEGLPNNYIRKVLPTPSGFLWVATDGGIIRFNPNSNKLEDIINKDENYSLLAEAIISSLALQADGHLWIGSSNGLYLLPPNETHLLRFTSNSEKLNSLAHHSIVGLLVDSKNTLWVDTAQGLERLVGWDENTAKFESMTAITSKLKISFGANLLEDNKGRIWTQSSVIDPKTLSQENLGRAEGVDIGTFWGGAYAKTRSGTLLYGGTEGLLMVKPERFKKWKYQPSIIISEIKVDGQKYFEDNTNLILSPTTKSFSVEFASTDFSAPEKNHYSYYLKGYDDGWVEASSNHRIANYTNLDPGDYTLRIRGSNHLGEWSPNEFELSITQLPTWYQTLWFRLFVFFFIVFMLYGLIKLRLHALKVQRLILRQQIKERTEELEIKNKALKKALENLEEISLTDQLTKVYNRHFLNKFINQELAKLYRDCFDKNNNSANAFGFIIVDIDHFKYVNDTYGHEAGDRVLVQFGDILTSTCRESDWVIRWGGEEFLVVGRFLKRDELQNLAERIRVNVENHQFNLGNGQIIHRTCSIGVTAFPFIKEEFWALTWEKTLNLADLAMYVAKDNGRNIWVSLFENSISEPTHFYKSAIINLHSQIDLGVISFETSLKEKDIDFNNKVIV